MKHILIFFILFAFASGLQVKVIEAVNIRDDKIYTNSHVITYVTNNEIFDVLDVYVSYYWVKIISGSQKNNRKGWIWSGILRLDNKGYAIVLGKGCTLRTKPRKAKSTENGYVVAEAKVQILSRKVIRYKVQGHKMSHFRSGWLSARFVEPI